MVKKITAIFFLTLASMIMLAFTVVPHHHHRESICFNNIHCEHESPDNGHHHDDEPFQSGRCCLENLFQSQISRDQSSEHSCCKGSCYHFAQLLFIVPDLSALLPTLATGYAFLYEVYGEKLHDSLRTSSLPGRAPPVFIS